MTACNREQELLDALGRAFVTADLAAHVEGCASCSELRLVAGALLDDRATAIDEAPVPAAGTMWWRLQLRYRREAQSAARRSLLIGQAATLAVAVTLAVVFFGADVAAGARSLFDTVRMSTPLLIALAAPLIAGPVAGWVLIRQK